MKHMQLMKSVLMAAAAMTFLTAAGCSSQTTGLTPDAAALDDYPVPAPAQDTAVADPPPRLIYEEPAAPPPQPGVVWIQPEFVLFGGGYELRHGRWGHPPQGRTRWVASHYEHDSRGYVYIGGRWD
jgi:hypothetical protein